MKNTVYAIVTGASMGIGRSIAMQLARNEYNLILVARSDKELAQLSANLQETYSVKVRYYALDLSVTGAAINLYEWCIRELLDISILINNAGYGLWGRFDQLSIGDQMNMIRLNVNAVAELTHAFMPLLQKQSKAYVLNVASTASYQPVPSLALYAASKSFIRSYSRAIRYELRNTNVSISCVCPGPTKTAFVQRAGLAAFGDLVAKFNMDPDYVAEAALNGMFRNKAETIPGFMNRIGAFAAAHLPDLLVEKVAAKLYSR